MNDEGGGEKRGGEGRENLLSGLFVYITMCTLCHVLYVHTIGPFLF